MLTDCGNVPWTNLNKAKLNNGYIRIPLPSANNPTTTSIMDYESSSDAALLDQQEQQPLNRDTSILLLDVNGQQQPQQQLHSNIINNPTNSSNLASPQHHVPSLRTNSISSSTSPTNKSQSVAVVVNLGNPNSMQTITTLQRNNVKNSSTKSTRSNNSIVLPIGNNNKPSDNINIFKAHKSSRKYKFNLLKLSSSSGGGASRSTLNRLLIFAICLIIFGIAIGALTIHLSGIYHCNSDRIGTYTLRHS